MNYFIKRDLSEYGPYTLADLQKYVASGNILLTDLCRSEGLTDWVPVSQVIGNIPVPIPAPQPAAGAVYGGTAGGGRGSAASDPNPPNPHWALVLLITFLTCGVFSMIWLVVEGLWLKKVKPDTKAVTYLTITISLYILIFVSAIAQGVAAGASGHRQPGLQGMILVLELGQFVMYLF